MPGSSQLSDRQKRLVYRAEHRGMKEMDVLIGGFVRANAGAWDEAMMDRVEKLLDGEQDADLYAWLLEQAPVPADVDADLLADIRAYRMAHQPE